MRRHQGSSLQVVSALPVTDIAVSPAFPSLVSLAFRVASAGFLLYSSLQWASARNSRKQVSRTDRMLGFSFQPSQAPALTVAIALTKDVVLQVERNMKDQEQRRSEQKKKLDRLRGATDKDQQE